MKPFDMNAVARDVVKSLETGNAASRKHGPPKEVVSIRLALMDRFALRQLAEVMAFTQTGAMRDCMVATMRKVMLDDPDWPMHPAWLKEASDESAIDLFTEWAWAITSEEPAAYLEKVRLDGVRAYRLRPGRPSDNILDGWYKHIRAHLERLVEKAEAASWSARRGDKDAKPVRRPRPAKKVSAGKRPAANKRPK